MPGRLLSALLGSAAAVLLAAADLGAQDPVPRDTLPRDSTTIAIPGEAVRADTLPDRRPKPDSVPADSTLPAPNFPLFPEGRVEGFGAGIWVFGAEELGRFHGLSLLELLDRIPGLVITREGSPGRPAGVASYGGGGGRLRVFMDGWELPALGASSPELQRIPLVDVSEVRVTRGLAETRVDIQTIRLSDRRPFAQIDGGEGDLSTRVLRGLFTRPIGGRLIGAVGLDLVETRGYRGAEPFNENTVFTRLSYAFTPNHALQLDYRTTAITASRRLVLLGTDSLPREEYDRGELLLRGRGRFFGRVWLDGAVGRSWQTTADDVTLEREAVQAYARAALDVPLGTVTGAFRWRQVDSEGFTANGTELSARAELAPLPFVAAWGEVRATSWGGVNGLEFEAAGRAGPWGGLSVFGSLASGNRGINAWVNDTSIVRNLGHVVNPELPEFDTLTVVRFPGIDARVNGVRAGAEWSRGPLQAGAAFVAHDLSTVAPFGFWFDRGQPAVSGGTVSGIEAYTSFPVLVRQIRADVQYTDFFATPERPYTPARFGRAALEYHWVYRGGNLEPTIRLEVIGRDEATLLNPETGAPDLRTQRYALMNLFVQVRVLDIRAFWRLDNVLNRNTAFDVVPRDLTGLAGLPGVRALFGVRWFLRD